MVQLFKTNKQTSGWPSLKENVLRYLVQEIICSWGYYPPLEGLKITFYFVFYDLMVFLKTKLDGKVI